MFGTFTFYICINNQLKGPSSEKKEQGYWLWNYKPTCHVLFLGVIFVLNKIKF